MGLGEFLRKTVTWPYCYSSLASRVTILAVASDEDHRSPREQELLASRVAPRSSPWRTSLLAVASVGRELARFCVFELASRLASCPISEALLGFCDLLSHVMI
ncbi:hypothetical protein MTR_2g048223 [Medicago truncatula]|uniref:Uncharacterized protein n=1 Tax=Medicago truncatula TaxID=3880 RepID=A0A072V865_MEDTR|nr:hypothetical protein MTR_2g048223 [Medicago truncatula]